MNELALELNAEEIQEGFSINNDNLAEWALLKIREEKNDMERLISVCDQKISEYEEKISNFKKQYENHTNFLKSQLNQYFESVPHKTTKTQETYKLPSGTLKLKYQKPEFIREEETLLKSLKALGWDSDIKTVEKPDWASVKNKITISGDKVVTADGEIIEGVTVQERPNIFDIEL